VGISSGEIVLYEVIVYISEPTINATALESNTTNISVRRKARKVFKAAKTKKKRRQAK
jgi:hypothetical protein